jgi:hypothetical protein
MCDISGPEIVRREEGNIQMKRTVRAFTTIFVLLLGTVAMYGQLYSGSVTGVVTDSTHALIPGAHVTITDQDKGTAFGAVTDANGRYLFPTIPPALYRISATAQGFETQNQRDIKIDVQQNITRGKRNYGGSGYLGNPASFHRGCFYRTGHRASDG